MMSAFEAHVGRIEVRFALTSACACVQIYKRGTTKNRIVNVFSRFHGPYTDNGVMFSPAAVMGVEGLRHPGHS